MRLQNSDRLLRPVPKTERGRETRQEIVDAALQLVCERWVTDIPFTDLAAAAGVARASLLHAFPNWRDVLYDIWQREIDQLDAWYVEARALKRARADARAFAMLRRLIDRAEMTGFLYPNLRSVMFTWHGQPTPEDFDSDPMTTPLTSQMLGLFALFSLRDHYAAVEELLGMPPSVGKPIGPIPIGECLVNFALDLAAGSPSHRASFDERRETLRTAVAVISAGVRAKRHGEQRRLPSPLGNGRD